MLTRRSAFKAAAGIAAAATFGATQSAQAADKVINVGINLSFTGADATSATRIANGAIMAFDEANARGEVKGYTFVVDEIRRRTATAGQYDPVQAANNARKMVSRQAYVAAIGPQMSGAGKAMAPILSQADLAIITPSSTNPDITDPKFAQQYRPAGKAIYFRTVATDAFQGPNMANYFAKYAEGENGFRARRFRRLRRGPRGCVPGAGRKEGHQDPRARPARSEGRRLFDDPDQD